MAFKRVQKVEKKERPARKHWISLTDEEQDAQGALIKLRTPLFKHNPDKIPRLSNHFNLSSANYPSLRVSYLDHQLASRQLYFDSLLPHESNDREDWAQHQLS